VKHEGKTRMPAQRQKTKLAAPRRQNADASAKAKNQTGRATKTKRGCQRKGQNNQTARAGKAQPRMPAPRQKTEPPALRSRCTEAIATACIPTASQTKKPTGSTTLPSATGIPGRLPLPKKLLITHNRAIRMRSTHMRDISLIVGHPDHQPHGLPEISPGVDHIIPKS
jgi:hypothetical protein